MCQGIEKPPKFGGFSFLTFLMGGTFSARFAKLFELDFPRDELLIFTAPIVCLLASLTN